jgi:ribosomal protein S13
MESKFHGNKLKKVAMMALTSIYSIGTMPTAHVIKHAREIEQNNMKAVTETGYVRRPPTLEEMIPVAREIVKNEVRNEFAEFLRKKAAGNPQQ